MRHTYADPVLKIGAHVGQEDPVAEGRARGADLVQFFCGDPQSWKKAVAPASLEAGLGDTSGLDLYVHAPYIVNVASPNNKIRIPSRKILLDHATVAASVGAKGLIVHGGHVTAGDEPAIGVENWVKTFERMECPLPVLVENTAGGEHAMARRFDALARLWDGIGGFPGVGFCLDTCHAHAGGEELLDVVERVKAITGRIDLVHCNDSRDAFGSGADRHANLGDGQIDPAVLLAVVAAADAPVVCETPGGRDGQSADITWLRENLPASS
ncbi:MAG: deoxyribonuclease [Frankiales bacterium]|nr:deoxyribonuclease [Frankiales bacterium]